MVVIRVSPDLEADTLGKAATLTDERASIAMIAGMIIRKLLCVFIVAETKIFYIKIA